MNPSPSPGSTATAEPLTDLAPGATTADAASTPLDVAPEQKSRFGWAVADTLTVTGRNLRTMQRVPQVIVFSTIQPVLFVLMFRYVFGGLVNIPGVPYVDYLMPGIFVQTCGFGTIQTAVGLSEDLHKGFIERFRSLPMANSAVLVGRTFADMVRNFFVVLLMVGVGYLVGFRIQTGFWYLLAAIGVLLAFSFALSWIFANIGLRAPTAEAAQAAAFPILMPLVFASTAFVPIAAMPEPLQVFARNQPVSLTVNAVRALVLSPSQRLTVFGSTGIMDHVVPALLWTIGLVAVFAPLAVRRYRRAV